MVLLPYTTLLSLLIANAKRRVSLGIKCCFILFVLFVISVFKSALISSLFFLIFQVIKMSNHDVFLAPEITMQEGGAAIDYEDDEDIIEEEEDEVTAYASNNGAAAAGYNVFGLPGSELPPEISITKVDRSKQQAASAGGPRRPPIIPKAANGRSSGGMAATNGGAGGGNFLKVRNDLGRALPPQASVAGPRMPGFNGGTLPPPLLKIGGQRGLPPMPKLKFGGPARPVRMPPRAPNPLAGNTYEL